MVGGMQGLNRVIRFLYNLEIRDRGSLIGENHINGSGISTERFFSIKRNVHQIDFD